MKKKSNTIGIVIIVSIILGIAGIVAGQVYMWSKDCQGEIRPGARTTAWTKCE